MKSNALKSANSAPLFLYEDIMLLALRDREGTMATSYPESLVAGAVLAELLLEQRITVDGSRRRLVNLRDARPFSDPVMDACLMKMKSAKRRAALSTWVSRLAGVKHLRRMAAERLCDRGVLRADERKILFLFPQTIYPEIDPRPEAEIMDRMRAALLSESAAVDPRTAVLISLAHGTPLLVQAFGRAEIKRRKKRIQRIVQGELVGQATREAIAACQNAAAMAAIMPSMMAAASS